MIHSKLTKCWTFPSVCSCLWSCVRSEYVRSLDTAPLLRGQHTQIRVRLISSSPDMIPASPLHNFLAQHTEDHAHARIKCLNFCSSLNIIPRQILKTLFHYNFIDRHMPSKLRVSMEQLITPNINNNYA